MVSFFRAGGQPCRRLSDAITSPTQPAQKADTRSQAPKGQSTAGHLCGRYQSLTTNTPTGSPRVASDSEQQRLSGAWWPCSPDRLFVARQWVASSETGSCFCEAGEGCPGGKGRRRAVSCSRKMTEDFSSLGGSPRGQNRWHHRDTGTDGDAPLQRTDFDCAPGVVRTAVNSQRLAGCPQTPGETTLPPCPGLQPGFPPEGSPRLGEARLASTPG